MGCSSAMCKRLTLTLLVKSRIFVYTISNARSTAFSIIAGPVSIPNIMEHVGCFEFLEALISSSNLGTPSDTFFVLSPAW